jgi:hypothetical protein
MSCGGKICRRGREKEENLKDKVEKTKKKLNLKG